MATTTTNRWFLPNSKRRLGVAVAVKQEEEDELEDDSDEEEVPLQQRVGPVPAVHVVQPTAQANVDVDMDASVHAAARDMAPSSTRPKEEMTRQEASSNLPRFAEAQGRIDVSQAPDSNGPVAAPLLDTTNSSAAPMATKSPRTSFPNLRAERSAATTTSAPITSTSSAPAPVQQTSRPSTPSSNTEPAYTFPTLSSPKTMSQLLMFYDFCKRPTNADCDALAQSLGVPAADVKAWIQMKQASEPSQGPPPAKRAKISHNFSGAARSSPVATASPITPSRASFSPAAPSRPSSVTPIGPSTTTMNSRTHANEQRNLPPPAVPVLVPVPSPKSHATVNLTQPYPQALARTTVVHSSPSMPSASAPPPPPPPPQIPMSLSLRRASTSSTVSVSPTTPYPMLFPNATPTPTTPSPAPTTRPPSATSGPRRVSSSSAISPFVPSQEHVQQALNGGMIEYFQQQQPQQQNLQQRRNSSNSSVPVSASATTTLQVPPPVPLNAHTRPPPPEPITPWTVYRATSGGVPTLPPVPPHSQPQPPPQQQQPHPQAQFLRQPPIQVPSNAPTPIPSGVAQIFHERVPGAQPMVTPSGDTVWVIPFASSHPQHPPPPPPPHLQRPPPPPNANVNHQHSQYQQQYQHQQLQRSVSGPVPNVSMYVPAAASPTRRVVSHGQMQMQSQQVAHPQQQAQPNTQHGVHPRPQQSHITHRQVPSQPQPAPAPTSAPMQPNFYPPQPPPPPHHQQISGGRPLPSYVNFRFLRGAELEALSPPELENYLGHEHNAWVLTYRHANGDHEVMARCRAGIVGVGTWLLGLKAKGHKLGEHAQNILRLMQTAPPVAAPQLVPSVPPPSPTVSGWTARPSESDPTVIDLTSPPTVPTALVPVDEVMPSASPVHPPEHVVEGGEEDGGDSPLPTLEPVIHNPASVDEDVEMDLDTSMTFNRNDVFAFLDACARTPANIPVRAPALVFPPGYETQDAKREALAPLVHAWQAKNEALFAQHEKGVVTENMKRHMRRALEESMSQPKQVARAITPETPPAMVMRVLPEREPRESKAHVIPTPDATPEPAVRPNPPPVASTSTSAIVDAPEELRTVPLVKPSESAFVKDMMALVNRLEVPYPPMTPVSPSDLADPIQEFRAHIHTKIQMQSGEDKMEIVKDIDEFSQFVQPHIDQATRMLEAVGRGELEHLGFPASSAPPTAGPSSSSSTST